MPMFFAVGLEVEFSFPLQFRLFEMRVASLMKNYSAERQP